MPETPTSTNGIDTRPFRERKPLAARIEEVQGIRSKFPNKIPVIVERFHKEKTLPQLDKTKFLVPSELTMSQFVTIIRNRMSLNASQAFYLLIDDKGIASMSMTLAELYEKKRSNDGFLYMSYASQASSSSSTSSMSSASMSSFSTASQQIANKSLFETNLTAKTLNLLATQQQQAELNSSKSSLINKVKKLQQDLSQNEANLNVAGYNDKEYSSLNLFDQSYDYFQKNSTNLMNMSASDLYNVKLEKISNNLRFKIESLIKSYSRNVNQRNNNGAAGSTSTNTLNTSSSLNSPSISQIQPANNKAKNKNNSEQGNFVSGSTNSTTSSSLYDENFISSLFTILVSINYKASNFRAIYNELVQSHVIKNIFLVIAKLGHECFKLNLLTSCECLLEFTLNKIDTSSLRLKMATLSTLSACYWRLGKFAESVNCMNLELTLASHLNESTNINEKDNNEIYYSNKYRIYGNLASAYQRLEKLNECLENFQLQLDVALKMNDYKLIISTLNSIGLVYNKLKDYEKSLEYFLKSLSIIETSKPETNNFHLLKIILKQFNLIGEAHLKLNNYEKSRFYFLQQLDLSNQLLNEQKNLENEELKANELAKIEKPIDDLEQHYLQEYTAILSLALVEFKLKNYKESIGYHEKCLASLQSNSALNSFKNLVYKQQIIELYGRTYIGTINSYLSLKDNLRAALYAHSMLDFTLKELGKLGEEQSAFKASLNETGKNEDFNELGEIDLGNESKTQNEIELENQFNRRFKYLKFIEMSACSKLATCYVRQNRLVDAFKLHQKEASLAALLNNTLYLTRAYSHMAQIYYISKDYEKCIYIYKQILHTIEMSLLDNDQENQKRNDNDEFNDLSDYVDHNHLINKNMDLSIKKKYERYTGKEPVKDERLIQMIYFTLSNIGLCMEMLNKYEDARLMFLEQLEISKLVNNLKFKANALLNLVNLYLNKSKLVENSTNDMKSTLAVPDPIENMAFLNENKDNLGNEEKTNPQQTSKNDQIELIQMLNKLFQVYKELKDTNGQLFTSQCLAFSYHTHGNIKKAIKYYLFNLEMCKALSQMDNMKKTLFNLSLCYKMLRNFEESYKYQMEYFNLISGNKDNDFSRFISLGLIADLLFEIDKSNENCQNCIEIHVDRLKIIKNAAAVVSLDNNESKSGLNEKLITNENKCKLISDCLESIAKCYYQQEDYQQVLKFKMLQVELQNEIEATNSNNPSNYKQKCKIWLDIGNLFLFKFENSQESYKYFEMVFKIAIEKSDLLLQSLTLGNLGLCKQKNGEYEAALELFKDQIVVLDKKLKSIDETSILNDLNSKSIRPSSLSSSSATNSSSSKSLMETSLLKADLIEEIKKSTNNFIKFNYENISKIKEIISIRIDMGRSYAKLGKCNELLSQYKLNPQLYLNEALKYYNQYSKECQYLFDNYAKAYFVKLEEKKLKSELRKKQKHIKKKRKKSVDMSRSELNESEDDDGNEEENKSKELDFFEETYQEINLIMKDLSEQIYIDYDTSLAKLASFYYSFDLSIKNLNNLDKSIELNEKRLSLLKLSSKYLLNKAYWLNLCVQINYMLANFYAKQTNTLGKSAQYCDNIIRLYNEESSTFIENNIESKKSKLPNQKLLKEDLYLIEALNLFCDVSIAKNVDNLDYDALLSYSIRAYKLIWQYSKQNDSKILQLKYDTMCRLFSIYRRVKMTKECLEILMDASNKLTFEFQQLQQQKQKNEQNKEENGDKKSDDSSKDSSLSTDSNSIQKNFCLIQYIEYLFLIHRKISLIHMKHASESNLAAKNKDLVEKSYLLSLKHVNESLTYLNYQKEFQTGQIIEFRQASVYFLLGKCHKFLKNSEMELEMFANSLDLYENIIPQNSYDSETCIKDRILSLQSKSIGCNELFESVRHDYDDETVVNYVQRIDHLYQHIEDALIKMNKLKEALLVTERHRTKMCSSLNNLQDILHFDQINQLVNQKNIFALIYYSQIEISSTLNCWLLQPNSEIVKFHQITYKSFDSLFLSKKGGSKAECSNFTDELVSCDEDEQNVLLKHVYNILIRPFESILFKNVNLNSSQPGNKPLVYMIYDERMFKIPFHLLKTAPADIQLSKNGLSDSSLTKAKYLFDYFEIDCIYSLKYLFKNSTYTQKYIKHQADSSYTIPMRIISNESDMQKLLTTSFNNQAKSNQFQYDLLVLLVNSEHKDVKSLNLLVNNLMSKRLAKAVLLEFNYYKNANKVVDPKQELIESEANAKSFLKLLYSKMVNRTTLKSSLIFSTLMIDPERPQKKLLNYLLFGNLGLYLIENILSMNQNVSIDSAPKNQAQPSEITKQDQSQIESIKITDYNDNKEMSLEDILFELVQDTNSVTISQVIIQFLKLNSKLDKTNLVLNIVVIILNDLLNGEFSRDESDNSVALKRLYEKFANTTIPSSQLAASRLMLKKLGFRFYIDLSGRYMVRLPEKSLEPKLKLISRCLVIFENLSSKLLKELFDLAKTPSGNELLNFMKQNQSQPKRTKTSLRIKKILFKSNERFLNEFVEIENLEENNEFIKIKCDTEVLNNLILLSMIILNDNMKCEAENSLQNYIEIYFKQLDEMNKLNQNENNKNMNDEDDNDDDLSSQYSTLSSLLGFQPPKNPTKETKKVIYDKVDRMDGAREIKIHREVSHSKITPEEIANVKQYASKLHKMIEINVDTESENPSIYDKYLSELLDRDLGTNASNSSFNENSVNKQFKKKNESLSNRQTLTVIDENKTNNFSNPNGNTGSTFNLNTICDRDDWFENEFKCKSLVKLEEKEYLDQIITTTTTVRTKTTDDLFMMFDSKFYDSENQCDDNNNTINSCNNLNLNTSFTNNSTNINNNNGNANFNHNHRLNNPSLYSSLTNYFSKNNKY